MGRDLKCFEKCTLSLVRDSCVGDSCNQDFSYILRLSCTQEFPLVTLCCCVPKRVLERQHFRYSGSSEKPSPCGNGLRSSKI